MLETIRESAGEKLEMSGQEAQIRNRHASYFLQLARSAYRAWFGPEQQHWGDVLETERDNFRVALSWYLDSSQPENAMRLAIGLSRFWYTRSQFVTEGQGWFDRIFQYSSELPRAELPRALDEASWLSTRVGDWERGQQLAEQSLDLSRLQDDGIGIAVASTTLALHLWHRQQVPRARALMETALEIGRGGGGRVITALALQNLGAWAHHDGQTDDAIPLLEESARLWRELGERRCLAMPVRHLSLAAISSGDLVQARELLRESLQLLDGTGDKAEIAECLEVAALIAAGEGDDERAVRVWGAATAIRTDTGASLTWAEEERRVPYWNRARTALPHARWEALFEEGRSMSLERGIAEALAETWDAPSG
jgi:hypothetical protein